MKKINIIMFIAALFLISSSDVSAQVHVSINVNSQPQWGPDEYDYVEYYYLPEFGIYYYAPKAQFIFRKGNRWVYAYDLPYQYRNVNLYSTYKVVINEKRPYLRNNYYASHYRKYKNAHSRQGNIRDSKNPKYRNANQSHSGNKVGNKAPSRNVQQRSGVQKNHVGNQNNDRNRNGNGQKGNKSQNKGHDDNGKGRK